MTSTTFDTSSDLNTELSRVFSHLRDLSVRDGIQSWDANKWPIDDILPVLQQINELAVVLKRECGIKLPPVEAWGGGQFAQPALFLGEDPFHNLEKLHAAAPYLELQCLYRGRQGFGFTPVSEEIQTEAIKTAANKGVKVFRIFDMMNDLKNLEHGYNAVNAYKKEHPGTGVVLEGAVAYISEPENGKGRAWTLEEYANFAVKLAKKGANEIAIKEKLEPSKEEVEKEVEALMKHYQDADKTRATIYVEQFMTNDMVWKFLEETAK